MDRYVVHVDGVTFWIWDCVDRCDAQLSYEQKCEVVMYFLGENFVRIAKDGGSWQAQLDHFKAAATAAAAAAGV